MTEVSRAMNKESGRINHAFGGRYKWSLIERDVYFTNAYKYVYRNPVEARLSNRVENYKFSTIATLLDNGWSEISVSDPAQNYSNLIPCTITEQINWLNVPNSRQEVEAVKLGLRKARFRFPDR